MKRAIVMRNPIVLVWTLALSSVVAPGCFKTPDPARIQCKTSAGCPTAYFCGPDNLCHSGSGAGGTGSLGSGGVGAARDGSYGDSSAASGGRDGAAADTQGWPDSSGVDGASVGGAGGASLGAGGASSGVGGASVGAGGASVGDGGGARDVSLADAPAGLPIGAACQSAAECAQGHCIDGICGETCSSSTDCAAGSFCASGSCRIKIADGASCAADSECKNGHCISGICCATTCGACNSCSTGTCKAADNGKNCGSGQFCNNGICGICPDGSTCNPDSNPCQVGKVSCSTGSAVCQNSVNLADGTSSVCGSGKVCKNGACASCAEGSACPGDTSDQCHTFAISCSTGTPVCKVSGNKPNTTPCGPGQTCSAGTEYDQAYCSNGSCPAQPTKTCPSTGCNGTSCASACDTSTQTACGSTCCSNATQYCSGTTCTAKVADNGSCPNGNNQCTSGNCSSGKCCPAGQTNSNGVCCSAGLTGCSGACVNTSTDNNNCGGCGSSYACAAGKHCSGGSCACDNTNSSCGTGTTCTACTGGTTCSSGTCSCPLGAPVICSNRCGGWTFDADPTSTSGWVAGSPGDGLASVHGGGTRIPNSSGYSLVLTLNSTPAEIMIPLCPLASNGVDLTGYRLQADIYIDGASNFFTTYTFVFGGSSATDPQAGSRITAEWLTGEWSKIDLTFNNLGSVNLSTGLYIQLVSGSGWTGTVYLDNILLTKN